MKAIEAMEKYRIPPLPPRKSLRAAEQASDLGDKVVICRVLLQRQEQPLLLWGHLQVHHHRPLCEGKIELKAASEVEFEDDGHAIAWAMAQ